MSDIDEETHELCERAIRVMGAEAQLRLVQEECGELIAKINHHVRGRCSAVELAEEVADAEIMVGQARLIVGNASVDEWRKFKLARLKARLNEVEA